MKIDPTPTTSRARSKLKSLRFTPFQSNGRETACQCRPQRRLRSPRARLDRPRPAGMPRSPPIQRRSQSRTTRERQSTETPGRRRTRHPGTTGEAAAAAGARRGRRRKPRCGLPRVGERAGEPVPRERVEAEQPGPWEAAGPCDAGGRAARARRRGPCGRPGVQARLSSSNRRSRGWSSARATRSPAPPPPSTSPRPPPPTPPRGTAPATVSRVISLVLPNARLTGALPPDLGRVEHLQHLDLAGNALNGTLPAALLDATELRVLSPPCHSPRLAALPVPVTRRTSRAASQRCGGRRERGPRAPLVGAEGPDGLRMAAALAT